MVQEVTSAVRLLLSSGVIDLDFNPGKIQLDYTPLVVYHARLLITVAEVTVTHGVTNPRFCVLYNHDATNYVQGGTTTTDYPWYLRPSSMASQFEIGPSKASIFLKANAANCYVEVIVF